MNKPGIAATMVVGACLIFGVAGVVGIAERERSKAMAESRRLEYGNGVEAYIAGAPAEANPYVNQAARLQWLKGWMDTAKNHSRPVNPGK